MDGSKVPGRSQIHRRARVFNAAQKIIKASDIGIYPDWRSATDAHNGRPANQPDYGGPEGPIVPLRAIGIIGPQKTRNDPGRPTSIDIYRTNKDTDVRVPKQSEITRVFELGGHAGSLEDLRWWTTSNGSHLADCSVRVKAKKNRNTVVALLIPQH